MSSHLISILRADMQLGYAHHMRWHPGTITVTDDEITMEGWAVTVWDPPSDLRALFNGRDFDEVQWLGMSADLQPYFPDLPQANVTRFFCRQRRQGSDWPYPGGLASFNVTSRFGDHALSYRTAWYFADPAAEPAMPSPEQIERVIGRPDAEAYLRGGATLTGRFDAYLRNRFDRTLASFDHVLDWGCGAGRLSRYLARLAPRLTGVDIDMDNIAMCRQFMPSGHFASVAPQPPTPLAPGSIDLVIGMSVLTHLNESNQNAWLAELQRVVRPRGLLLLSIAGKAQSHLYQDWGDNWLTTHRLGLRTGGPNTQLRNVLDDAEYYRDVQHSHDYVAATWQRFFDVLDIVPALACGQDLVVLRARP